MPAATAPAVSDDVRTPDFDAIFRQHAPMVYRTARAVTGRPEEAEEVLQTLFLRLIRGEHSAGLWKSPKAYLHRAAVNLSLDLLKARRRRAFALDVDALALADPATTHHVRPGHPALDGALAELEPDAVQLLTLRYVHGYSDAEIAGQLGTSRGAIALRLFRLRRRLKRFLVNPRGEKR
jgi:RNA polymerase sigma-70 factor (ECF subfamily)